MQLALLNKDFGSFNSSKSKVIAIANRLLEKENIPIVSENLEFIEKLCFPEWWQDINLIMLEDLRRKIRNLLALEIESKKPLYTNFKDTISEGEIVNFEELVETDESEKLLEKIKISALNQIKI